MVHVFYDDSGRIRFVSTAPEGLNVVLSEEDGVTPDTHYMDGGVVTQRERLNVEHEIQGLEVVFSALPVGTSVEGPAGAVVVDEDGVSIEFDAPGVYILYLYPPARYIDQWLEVTVG